MLGAIQISTSKKVAYEFKLFRFNLRYDYSKSVSRGTMSDSGQSESPRNSLMSPSTSSARLSSTVRYTTTVDDFINICIPNLIMC